MTACAAGRTLTGADGNDTLNGNLGSDTISGGAGTDSIRGGRDNDTVNGDAAAVSHSYTTRPMGKCGTTPMVAAVLVAPSYSSPLRILLATPTTRQILLLSCKRTASFLLYKKAAVPHG